MERISFEDAIDRTMCKNKPVCGSWFQKVVVICAVTSIMTGFVILGGISFLEKVPNKFECRSDSLEVIILRNENMTHEQTEISTNNDIQSYGDWKSCSQHYICKNNLNLYKDLFRYDEKDPEYIDNWIQKFDLLCKPTEYIGLIGSCYMVGMFIGFFILPPYSDTYGRRPVFIFTMFLSSIAQGIILFTSSIHKLFLFMIILGCTFSGKNIVGLNYAIESVPLRHQKVVVSIYWSVELFSIILWSFYYQKLDKNWFPLQAIYFGGGILVLIISTLFFPESPKFLYSKQKFEEARESLAYMAKFNRNFDYNVNFIFENEVVSDDLMEEKIEQIRHESEQRQQELEEEEEQQNLMQIEQKETEQDKSDINNIIIKRTLSDEELYINLIKMTIMWTSASFNQFLLSAQMKYLEGNIFTNFYVFGIAGLLSVVTGGYLYTEKGLKFTYYTAHVLQVIGCGGMLMIQCQVFTFKTDEAKDAFDEILMPILILILKMGIIIGYITTTQISFTCDQIFPPNKRNTSVGTCGMVARSVTIVAPIVNEWDPPYPIFMMLGFSILGFVTSYTFNDIREGDDEKQIIKLKDDTSDDDSQVTYHNVSKQFQGQEDDIFESFQNKKNSENEVKSTGHTENNSKKTL